MKRIISILLALALVLGLSLVTVTPAAASSPPVTSGLVLHLDANDAGSITKDIANRVSQWADLSGNNNHATQPTSARQPLWVDNVLVGKPVIRFDGSGDYLDIASDTSNMPGTLTISVIVRPNKLNARQSIVAKWDGGGDASYSLELTSANKFLFYLHNGTTTQSITGTTIVTAGTPYHVVALYDGTNASLYVDGGLEAGPTATVGPMTNSNVPLRIGGSAAVAPYPLHSPFGGDIAEILIYDRALSDGERQQVEQYLGIKWLATCHATETSTGTACFHSSQGTIEDLTAVSVPADSPAGVLFPHGMFEFKVTGLASGETVTITIELPGPVPVGTKWWKYQNGSWYPMNIGDDDGDNFITVTFKDKTPTDPGLGDEDSTGGLIHDDGGPGNPGAVGWETYTVNKARVLLPWITLGAAIVAGASLLVLRRRRAQS